MEGGKSVPKFLLKASYAPEGARGILKEGGTSRASFVKQLTESVGGTLEGFYFAFGDVDAYVILDLPDASTAAALSLSVSASGAVSTKTVALLTPEEIDQAASKTVDYRAPGA
jgi:uncharacterized protein with GYD domain